MEQTRDCKTEQWQTSELISITVNVYYSMLLAIKLEERIVFLRHQTAHEINFNCDVIWAAGCRENQKYKHEIISSIM